MQRHVGAGSRRLAHGDVHRRRHGAGRLIVVSLRSEHIGPRRHVRPDHLVGRRRGLTDLGAARVVLHLRDGAVAVAGRRVQRDGGRRGERRALRRLADRDRRRLVARRSNAVIGLHLHHSAVARLRGVDQHPDPISVHRRERELPPHPIVAADRTARHRHPGRAVPVLHVERDDAIAREGHRLGGIHRRRVVVLDGEHVDLVDALHPVERDLHPIRVGSRGRIAPTAAAAPVQALSVTVVHGRSRIVRTIGRRCARHPTIGLQRHVDALPPRVDCDRDRSGGPSDELIVHGTRRQRVDTWTDSRPRECVGCARRLADLHVPRIELDTRDRAITVTRGGTQRDFGRRDEDRAGRRCSQGGRGRHVEQNSLRLGDLDQRLHVPAARVGDGSAARLQGVEHIGNAGVGIRALEHRPRPRHVRGRHRRAAQVVESAPGHR